MRCRIQIPREILRFRRASLFSDESRDKPGLPKQGGYKFWRGRGSLGERKEFYKSTQVPRRQNSWPPISAKWHAARWPDAGRVRFRRQRARQSLRPGVSWNSSQPNESFNMKGLRKQIEKMHFGEFVANPGLGNFFRLAWRVYEHR